jgi:tetratricopeptide (TPR) repeat protein
VSVAAPDLAAIGFSKEASDIITAVITGEVDPEQGATRLAGVWVPAEELGSGSGRQSAPPQGSVASLNQLASQLATTGQNAEARRLAELNWLLARHAADETAAVQCAATLAQLLGSDQAAVKRRLDLLEYAVPEVLASDDPDLVKAVLLANLAEARYNAAGGDPDTLTAAIDASRQALAIDADLGEAWLADLHFMAGTALQTLGDLANDEGHYRESIASLTEVLNYYGPQHQPQGYASALNNLGNSYRKLAARTGDAALAQTAIECFDLALPYRPDGALTRTTQANRAAAVRLLETMSAATQAPPHGDGADVPARTEAAAFLEAGDAALTEMRAIGDEAPAFRRLATDRYLAAAKLTGRDSPPDLRARVYHRLATAFATADEDDALWTGVCFATAARRLGGEALAPAEQGRLAFHLGFMLMKIGLPDQLAYLRKAEALLKEALPLLKASNDPGERDYAAGLHDGCLTALAAFGDENAREQALRMHTERELARIDLQLSKTPADEVHAAYRNYLTVVRASAGAELASFLAAAELTTVRAAIARDGEYPAMVLARTAAAHRNVGDLTGALGVAADAESRAGDIIYFAPATWCELVSFYTTVPAKDDAERCLRNARETAEQAGSAAEPDQIEAAAAAIAAIGSLPRFDPAVTAAALAPADDADRLCRVLEQGLQSIGEAES